MERQHYSYRVLRLNDQHTTLMSGDIFKFDIGVLYHTLLYPFPSQSISSHNFFHEGQDILRTVLRAHFSIECLDEITEKIVSTVRELFNVDTVPPPPPPSPSEIQCREIPLFVKIFILNNGVRAAVVEEEYTQCSGMIPASNEAIQTSLKKCMVTTQSESCCPVCLEDLDIDAESYTMPCHHLFHLKCIVSWLQTSHVCPLCRYPLPTLKRN